jgi:hypothetical protein
VFLLSFFGFSVKAGIGPFNRWLASRTRRSVGSVWAGRLAELPPELAYTATGFSNPLRATLNTIFHPAEVEHSREMVVQHFRAAIRRTAEEVHVLDRIFCRPVRLSAAKVASGPAKLHHGRLNVYVAYVLLDFLTVLLIVRYL